jgi:hypothetical protein
MSDELEERSRNRNEWKKATEEKKNHLGSKVKLSRYRPEQAHGRSGRLRPLILLTFGTRRW